MQFAVYAAYRLRLETALLADQTTSASATAAAMEPPPGSPEACKPQSPFQEAAKQHQTAVQAAVQSPLLQQGSLPAEADAAALPAASQLQPPVTTAWSEQQRSRTAETAHDMVEASVRLAAEDRGGTWIVSCSPHVTRSPAAASPQAEPAAPRTGTQVSASAAEPDQQRAVTQQPEAEAGAGAAATACGQDDSSASAAASPPVSAPQSPRASSAVQSIAEAQRLFMSTACRNPTKKLLCEPSTVQVIHTYESGGGQCWDCAKVGRPHQLGLMSARNINVILMWNVETVQIIAMQTSHWQHSLRALSPRQTASVCSPTVATARHTTCAPFCTVGSVSRCQLRSCLLGRSYLVVTVDR
jgi:hypothetical protein